MNENEMTENNLYTGREDAPLAEAPRDAAAQAEDAPGVAARAEDAPGAGAPEAEDGQTAGCAASAGEDEETAAAVEDAAEEEKKNGATGDENRAAPTDAAESAPTVEIVGVSFRQAGKVYYFSPGEKTLTAGQRVIVETARGLEIGTVKIPNKKVPESEIVPPLKQITRPATAEDLEHDARNRSAEMDAAVICKRKIAEHKLQMKLVAAEYTFDNSKLTFYFTSETRVDFRDLVRNLASTFRTRIELRQIGIRDEAKIMGGLGTCGRKYCCAGFLTDFVQVSIKMAKEQNFSLNSSKVSGACGRLMCCLRYEHETYEDAIRVTPPTGSLVRTPDGEGVVSETKPLAGEIRVRLSDSENERDAGKFYKIADVRVLRTPNGKKFDIPVPEEEASPTAEAAPAAEVPPRAENPRERRENRENRGNRNNRGAAGGARREAPAGQTQERSERRRPDTDGGARDAGGEPDKEKGKKPPFQGGRRRNFRRPDKNRRGPANGRENGAGEAGHSGGGDSAAE